MAQCISLPRLDSVELFVLIVDACPGRPDDTVVVHQLLGPALAGAVTVARGFLAGVVLVFDQIVDVFAQ